MSLILCGLALSALPCFAEAPRFVRLTRDQGLSDNTVSAIVEDEQGFMWLGTPDGLNRYDGYGFRVYRNDPDDDRSLSQNTVWSVALDPDGSMWVGTLNGLNRYDPTTDTFERRHHDPQDPRSLSSDTVQSMLVDRSGTLWVGTSWGLNRLAEDGAFDRFPPSPDGGDGPCAASIWGLLEDRDGGLWVAGASGGVAVRDPVTKRFTCFVHGPDPTSIAHNHARGLWQDDAGAVWLATFDGLDRFDPERRIFEHFRHDPADPSTVPSPYVTVVHGDRRGRVWVGTDGGGLARFDPERGVFEASRHDPGNATSLGSDVVRTLYEDSKGDLWVGTFTGGVNVYSDAAMAFEHQSRGREGVPGLSHPAVLSFHEDADGTLWIGTEGGLNRRDPDGSFRAYVHDRDDPSGLAASAVLALLRDRAGTLWVGTYHGGLHRMVDEERGVFERFAGDPGDPSRLSSPHVWDIAEDPDGRLWLGTFNGLNRLDPKSGEIERFLPDPVDPHALRDHLIRDVLPARDGTVWVTSQGGLSRFDRESGHFQTFRRRKGDPASLSLDQVISVTEDRQGRLWIGTEGGGLNLFDGATETFRAFRTDDGLASDTVFGILEDENGLLWLSTNGGLSRFDPATETFVNYDKSDGVLALPMSLGAYLRCRDGDLLFGGTNGYVRFDPADVGANPHVPPVVLTDFRVFNESVPIGEVLDRSITEAQRIELRYDQSVFSLEFAALNFRAPEKNRYAYRLERFDQEWRDSRGSRIATYTNLDPGRYVFRVRGSNNSGVWNEQGASIEIEILPPFWLTWWFRGASILAVVGWIAVWYRRRVLSLKTHARALQVEIEERTKLEAERLVLMDEMAAQNKALEVQNKELERITYTLSHNLKTPIVTIKGFLGHVRDHLRGGRLEPALEDLGPIQQAADRMQRLVQDLVELRRLGRQTPTLSEISAAALVDQALARSAEEIAAAGVEIRRHLENVSVLGDSERLVDVFDHLTRNAVQALAGSPRPRLELSVRSGPEDGWVHCTVRDNGKGIEADFQEQIFDLFNRLDAETEGTGIGLTLCRRIVELHGGRLWVESEGIGQGASFHFTLPSAAGITALPSAAGIKAPSAAGTGGKDGPSAAGATAPTTRPQDPPLKT